MTRVDTEHPAVLSENRPVSVEDSAAENSNFKLTKLFPILLESTNIYPNSSQIFSSLSFLANKFPLNMSVGRWRVCKTA